MGGAVALGLSVFLIAPAAQAQETGPAPAATGTTIYVPSGFDSQLQDTRAHGHYEVVGTGLHIWTDSAADVDENNVNQDKVAEYVDTTTPLARVGEPSLEYTPSREGLTDPGFQLVVDLNGDRKADGILVGEPGSYGHDWWLSGPLKYVDVPGAPGPAFGYVNAGSLEQWNGAFPNAEVLAFGFSLGSGVLGDGTLNAINFAGTSYTFAPDVVLASKDDCKGGGWATSTDPVYKNQGECVSHFATTSNNGNGNGNGNTGLSAPVSTPTSPAATTVLTARNSGKIRAI